MKQEDFSSHDLWNLLDQFMSLLQQVDGLVVPEVSEKGDEVREMLSYTQSFRESEDHILFSRNMLDQANDSWTSVRENFVHFVDDPAANEPHLAIAMDFLDGVRDVISRFPKPSTSPGVRGAFSRALAGYLDLVGRSRDAMAQRVEDFQTAQVDREESHAATVTELTERISGLKDGLQALEARLESDETRLNDALTSNNETFNTSQTTREQTFSDWLGKQEDQFTRLADPHVATIKSKVDDATKALEQIERLRTSVTEMSSLAAGDIMGNQFATSAKNDRIAAYVGYIVGVVLGLGGVAVALWAFGGLTSALEWQQVALKLGLTAAIGGIAAVAFRFASQALRRATSFKRQELELRSLQPFLFEVDGADAARVAFFSRSFGHAWNDDSKSKSEFDESLTPSELAKMFTALVEKLPKS